MTRNWRTRVTQAAIKAQSLLSRQASEYRNDPRYAQIEAQKAAARRRLETMQEISYAYQPFYGLAVTLPLQLLEDAHYELLQEMLAEMPCGEFLCLPVMAGMHFVAARDYNNVMWVSLNLADNHSSEAMNHFRSLFGPQYGQQIVEGCFDKIGFAQDFTMPLDMLEPIRFALRNAILDTCFLNPLDLLSEADF